MPRDQNGNYTPAAGNPVVPGTLIESDWANPTVEDISEALSDSLDRQGRGGMLAPFNFLDGTKLLPGLTFTAETDTGFYREGVGDFRATVSGSDSLAFKPGGPELPADKYSSWAGSRLVARGAVDTNTGAKIGLRGCSVLGSTSSGFNLILDATITGTLFVQATPNQVVGSIYGIKYAFGAGLLVIQVVDDAGVTTYPGGIVTFEVFEGESVT